MTPALLRLLPAVFLALLALLVHVTLTRVDLTPQVDARFFFSPKSPDFKEAQALDARFRGQELLIITAASDDIATEDYQRRIKRLTQALQKLRDVQGVRSLANGPENLEDARKSPLWRRLLLLKDVQATLLVMVVNDRDPARLVGSVQEVMRAHEHPQFRLQLAGVPYVVDEIGRNLKHDFRVFSLAAVGLFAIVVLLLFRSWAILLGSLTACGMAALLTLLLQQAFGGRLGLLTANLITIAFVLTQSHVVFMTGNWRNLPHEQLQRRTAVSQALRRTFGASGWSMATTLLGFLTLWFVEAQPLRELGAGGTLAALLALACAYLVFPPFLLWARPPARARPLLPWIPLRLPHPAVALAVLVAALGLGLGAARLNTDPSLLEYFAADSDVRRSLEAIDPYGGSSPLNIAVRRADGEPLDNRESYERMWALQRALQKDPAVGNIVSLPVLMAEADRNPLGALLPWNVLLDLLSSKRFDRVAASFTTEDRRQALYMLRMVESAREERRVEVVERLEKTIRDHGFEPMLVGGIYGLQGRLAAVVTRSLIEGLLGLLTACALIAFIVTRSLRGGLLMLLAIATVPTVTLGLFGLLRTPLDVIATPAVNVALGVAVDAMIHLGTAWRLARRQGEATAAIRLAQRQQAGGILGSTLVVATGFAIFAFSSFPPTQRFGMAVVVGATVAALMALWILPALLLRHAAPSRGPAR